MHVKMCLQNNWLHIVSLALPAQFSAVTEISYGALQSDRPVRLTIAVPLMAFTLMDIVLLMVTMKRDGTPPLMDWIKATVIQPSPILSVVMFGGLGGAVHVVGKKKKKKNPCFLAFCTPQLSPS